MIPGFVTAYRDKENYVHLYFYPGLDDNDSHIYKDIDLSSINESYDLKRNIDNSVHYKFLNKKIVKFYCKLLTIDNNEFLKILEV